MEDKVQELYDALNESHFTVAIIGATGCYTSTYWDYRKKSAKIIQINPGRTYFDSVADLNIREEADPVFMELMKRFD